MCSWSSFSWRGLSATIWVCKVMWDESGQARLADLTALRSMTAHGHTMKSDQSWPQLSITILPFGVPLLEPSPSIFFTISEPSVTSPKTTCLPSSQAVTTVVMKNCDPLVFGPALAIDSRNGLLCFSLEFSNP